MRVKINENLKNGVFLFILSGIIDFFRVKRILERDGSEFIISNSVDEFLSDDENSSSAKHKNLLIVDGNEISFTVKNKEDKHLELRIEVSDNQVSFKEISKEMLGWIGLTSMNKFSLLEELRNKKLSLLRSARHRFKYAYKAKDVSAFVHSIDVFFKKEKSMLEAELFILKEIERAINELMADSEENFKEIK